MATRTSLYSLPNELLTQIAECFYGNCHLHLDKSDLVRLARVSKKLRPIAEDVIYRSANVSKGVRSLSEGSNDLLQLLRTFLARPELANKLKVLYFRTVRRSRAMDYVQDGVQLNLKQLRQKSLVRLKNLGFDKGDPWYTMTEASIESAFAGLLLAMVPNVEHLKMHVLDHMRGDPCTEPVLAMFGTSSPPAVVLPTFRNTKSLAMMADHFPMLALDFANLTTLELDHLSTRDMLRLNGPNSMRGAAKVKKLVIELVIQVAEEFVVIQLGVKFRELLGAMGSPALTHLEINFFNEGCRCKDGHTIEMATFVEELDSVSSTLVELKLGFDDAEGGTDDQEWILGNAEPIKTLTHFTALRCIKIPEKFLWDQDTAILGINELLPSSLADLEIIAPHKELLFMLEHVAEDKANLPELDRIVLHCRAYNTSAHEFWNDETSVWDQLNDRGITTVVESLDTGISHTMPVNWMDDEMDDGRDSDDDDEIFVDDGEDGDDDDDDDDDNEDIPDLEPDSGAEVTLITVPYNDEELD